MDDSTLAKIEKQRLELEENIAKLRGSLRHWQTLEIDYEGLREEFQALPQDASQEECLQAARDFKPELVDDKELQSLFEDKRSVCKRPSHIVEIFSKRVDYVTRNISTIRKQLSDVERKRNALLLAQNPEHQDDAGLPLGEIIEELDEEGKVVSSKVQTPGNNTPDLLEVLRKAGVSDIKDGANADIQGNEVEHEDANGFDIVSAGKPGNILLKPTSALSADERFEEVSDDGDDKTSEHVENGPLNPDDSEEDAALRQEMLQYGLGEVGAIVAELDLQDSGNHSGDDNEDEDDYLSDYDEDEDLYTDESEDEKGATKNPVISERYKRQMEALSKKHGIKDLKNLGPGFEIPEIVKEQLDRPSAAEAARQAAIAREEEVKKSAPKSIVSDDKLGGEPEKKKKKVAFAPALDIADETSRVEASRLMKAAANPVGDTVIERTSNEVTKSTLPPSTMPPKPKKISRFKAARSATPPTPMFPPPMEFPSPAIDKSTPEGPLDRTISGTLIERPASKITTPADPADFDEELHRREVAVEYQKMRNRKIHEQGGYVKGGEQENYGEEMAPEVVMDENTGKPRKISRFKAARMKS